MPANLILAGGDLRAFKSLDELRSALQKIFLQKVLEEQIYRSVGSPVEIGIPLAAQPAGQPAAAPAPLRLQGPAGFYTTTNVQVAGVDEPDVVKTDGRILAVASGSRVYVVGISEGLLLSKIDLEGHVEGLLLEGDRLAVLHSRAWLPRLPPAAAGPGSPRSLAAPVVYGGNVGVDVYDLKDPSRPLRIFTLDVSGLLAGARLLNFTAYLVVSSPLERGTPTINGTPLPPENVFRVDEDPVSYNTVVALDLRGLSYSASSLVMGQSSWIYMSPGRLYIISARQPGFLEALSSVLAALAKRLPDNVSTTLRAQLERGDVASALATASGYLSTAGDEKASELVAEASIEASARPLGDSTKVYAMDLLGLRARYRGSLEVPGIVLDQFSFEEMGRYIVVATTSRNYSVEASWAPRPLPAPATGGNLTAGVAVTICRAGTCTTEARGVVGISPVPGGEAPPGPRGLVLAGLRIVGDTSNNVFTADLEGLSLKASLRGLAKGERIYASRLVGSTLYLVTFRQVDPLFAIDLSDPGDPKVLGLLKVPGLSEYLHPVGRGLLLGIGAEDASLKISLFRVSDPSRIEEASKILIKGAWSHALHDHHALTEIPGRGLVMIPVRYEARAGAPVSGIALVAVEGDSLDLKAVLGHRDALRSVAIERGGEIHIYTVSPRSVKIFSLESLSQVGEIGLN